MTPWQPHTSVHCVRLYVARRDTVYVHSLRLCSATEPARQSTGASTTAEHTTHR